MVRPSNFLLAAGLASLAAAHPGEKHNAMKIKREIEARNTMARVASRSLGACAGSLKHRQLVERNIARRSEAARKLREKRGITGSM